MDEQKLQMWQELHRRHVDGETLSKAEAEAYEAGCQELDSLVNYDASRVRLHKSNEELAALRAELEELQEQGRKRDAHIAELETLVDAHSHQFSSAKG